MWSKMLLLSLNILVLLAIVDSGNVIFKDQTAKKNQDNETGTVDQKMQSPPLTSTADNESNKKEVYFYFLQSKE